jgi:hypothetical protein
MTATTHTQRNAPAVQYAMMVRMTLSKSRSFARKLCMPASSASSTTHAYTQQHPAGLVVPSHRPVLHHHAASTARCAKAAPAALTAGQQHRAHTLPCLLAIVVSARQRRLTRCRPRPVEDSATITPPPVATFLHQAPSKHPGHHYCELPAPPAGQPPPPHRRL